MVLRNVSCKSDDPPQEPEVRVDIRDGQQWVRLPVTLCELWLNKDGPADITRTAKVKVPAQWDGNSITSYINGFDPNTKSEYDECRIWFYDDDLDEYKISHYGYVGGVGPAAETGVLKFWVYDPADLMRGISVSKTWDGASPQQVLEFVLRGRDETGEFVGLERRSIFSDVGIATSATADDRSSVISKVIAELLEQDGDEQSPIEQIGTFAGLVVTLIGSFQRNRNNMVDVMDWLATNVNGKWHFEPTPEGPLLYLDMGEGVEEYNITRRRFADAHVDDEESIGSFTDLPIFSRVNTTDNSTLYDIKPFNTLSLYGEDTSNVSVDETGSGDVRFSQTSRFPYVKLTYPPLVERAGGYEYAASSVESDAEDLSKAKQEAVNEFRKHLEEETEGSMTIKGEPFVLPYDYISTYPVCNELYTHLDTLPITYEINAVKHSRSANERYTTELGVSLVFDESLLNIEAEYRAA